MNHRLPPPLKVISHIITRPPSFVSHILAYLLLSPSLTFMIVITIFCVYMYKYHDLVDVGSVAAVDEDEVSDVVGRVDCCCFES